MKRASIVTFGCKVNQYESQALQERLRERGWAIVPSGEAAELFVINTCTVTETAAREAARVVRRLHRKHPAAEFTVTGCAADSHRAEFEGLPGVRRVVVHDEKSALPLLVEDPRLQAADLQPSIFDLNISGFEGRTRAFLKVQDGCDLNCSFCIIPQVRGANESRALDEAIEEGRRLAANGYREIVITGVHVGSFGKDTAGRSLLPDLARGLMGIPGVARIRLSSIEANEVGDELLDTVAGSGGRFCPHFHLPLQSGDEGVLRDMRRRYNPAQFRRTVERIRARVPEAALTTDVIVGFPTESDAAFENTMALCREAEFSRIHIFPYSPRSGTDAAALRDLPGRLKKARLNALEGLAGELTSRFAARFVSRDVEVLVEEGGQGYTERYLRASVAGAEAGALVRARVDSVEDGILQCA